jgi:uncharacterized damage-inducible protein DinB
MHIDSKFLFDHLEYSRWATERSMDSARPLTEEERTRYMYVSHRSVLGTLVHIYEADRIWFSRLLGSPRFTLSDQGENYTLDGLAVAWKKLTDEFIAWISVLTDEEVESTLKYVNIQGIPGELKIWQVVLHVVNHATYHRGQVTTMLRQLNHTPIITDLAAYYNRPK